MYRASLPYYYIDRGEYFEDYETFSARSKPVITTQAEVKSCGTVLLQGKKRNEILTTDDEFHTFIIGETGSGKTRRVILPTIRLLSKTGESMVITDPKGELYRYTAKALEGKGYDVKLINLKEPLTGSRYNPLSEIDRLYHSRNQDDREEAQIQIKDVIRVMKERIHDGNQVMWENTAGYILQGVILLILQCGKQGDLSFASINSVYQGIAREMSADNPVTIGPFQAFYRSLPADSEIKVCFACLFNKAGERTRGSYFSLVSSMLSAYCDQAGLQDNMSASDLNFDELGRRPTALYMILPDYSQAMYALGSLYLTQIYQALVRLADKQSDGLLPNKVCFVLDEFANFSRIPDMSSMLTAARSRGIRFSLVCQSMEQLISEYTAPGAETMMANCRVWIYMNCRNLPFLNRMEELCGRRILTDGSSMPLMPTSELLHLRLGEVVVLNDRCRPLRGFLPDYSEYDFDEGEVSPAVPKKRKKQNREILTMAELLAKRGREKQKEDFFF